MYNPRKVSKSPRYRHNSFVLCTAERDGALPPRLKAAIRLNVEAGMQRYRARFANANVERQLREVNGTGSCELMGLLIESHLANFSRQARVRTVHVFDATRRADVHLWLRQHLTLIGENFPCCDIFYYRFNDDGTYTPCYNLVDGQVIYPSANAGALYRLA